MNQKIETLILTMGIFCASSAYSTGSDTDKRERDNSKYAPLLSAECGQVRFENNAVICEDTSCKKYEQEDCGRKYCIEQFYIERWRFSSQDLHNLQLILQEKDQTFPYAISYQPKSGESKLLFFRSEKNAREFKQGEK